MGKRTSTVFSTENKILVGIGLVAIAVIYFTDGFGGYFQKKLSIDACRCVQVFEADATGRGSYWSPKDVEECESHYRSVALRRNKPEYWCAVDDCDNSKK